MDKIVIERFTEGQMCAERIVELSHRLLNEADLDALVGEGAERAFVRNILNTTNGYFKDGENRWTFGNYDEALKEIKRKI